MDSPDSGTHGATPSSISSTRDWWPWAALAAAAALIGLWWLASPAPEPALKLQTSELSEAALLRARPGPMKSPASIEPATASASVRDEDAAHTVGASVAAYDR